MKRATGLDTPRLAGLLTGLAVIAAWTAFALAPAYAEPHAHGPGADSHGAVPLDSRAPSTAIAPRTRFDAPTPGSYELPAIDRVAPHDLLGISGLSERLIAIGPGELALVSFVYLSCDEACPLSTALLHQLDRALAEDAELAKRIELVTVSFDPARDTPQAMAELHDRMAPRGRWRFLTAKDEASLRPVLADFGQDAVWIPGGKNAPDALRHVLKVYLVDAGGAVRQIYSTGFLDVRLVLADLRTLLPTAP
jgi:cytochrome oxidase Cu insertion factor (SCO1/SenC/PrrC family)